MSQMVFTYQGSCPACPRIRFNIFRWPCLAAISQIVPTSHKKGLLPPQPLQHLKVAMSGRRINAIGAQHKRTVPAPATISPLSGCHVWPRYCRECPHPNGKEDLAPACTSSSRGWVHKPRIHRRPRSSGTEDPRSVPTSAARGVRRRPRRSRSSRPTCKEEIALATTSAPQCGHSSLRQHRSPRPSRKEESAPASTGAPPGGHSPPRRNRFSRPTCKEGLAPVPTSVPTGGLWRLHIDR
mmetsp:Transcript_7391/g.11653  ORF Transcript_7391/g.11653 Transcript_7391/m.11653 type:complete len:239 (-) Transcript_7391:240-956(-)